MIRNSKQCIPKDFKQENIALPSRSLWLISAPDSTIIRTVFLSAFALIARCNKGVPLCTSLASPPLKRTSQRRLGTLIAERHVQFIGASSVW